MRALLHRLLHPLMIARHRCLSGIGLRDRHLFRLPDDFRLQGDFFLQFDLLRPILFDCFFLPFIFMGAYKKKSRAL